MIKQFTQGVCSAVTEFICDWGFSLFCQVKRGQIDRLIDHTPRAFGFQPCGNKCAISTSKRISKLHLAIKIHPPSAQKGKTPTKEAKHSLHTQKKMPFYAFQVRLPPLSGISISHWMGWGIMLLYQSPGSVFDGRPALRVSQKLKCQFHHKPKWRTYRITHLISKRGHGWRLRQAKKKKNYWTISQ